MYSVCVYVYFFSFSLIKLLSVFTALMRNEVYIGNWHTKSQTETDFKFHHFVLR